MHDGTLLFDFSGYQPLMQLWLVKFTEGAAHFCLTSSVIVSLKWPNSLYAEYMIPRRVYELVCNENKCLGERGVALLDCVESRIEAVPSDFTKVVHILEEEPFLESLAKDLVESYCKGLMQNVRV